MKKRLLLSITALTLLTLFTQCGPDPKTQQPNNTMNPDIPFTPFDVQQDFTENGFAYFTKNLVLCSGDSTESNAMAIGWGSIGNYLGHERPTVTVYVAPARYTYNFMERHSRFTIMEFDDPKVWQHMGKASGRDYLDSTGSTAGDKKAAAIGLHVAYTPNGTPYYKEAKTVIECEIMTAWHQDSSHFRNDTPQEWYQDFEAGIHTLYIGEVIGAWKKQTP